MAICSLSVRGKALTVLPRTSENWNPSTGLILLFSCSKYWFKLLRLIPNNWICDHPELCFYKMGVFKRIPTMKYLSSVSEAGRRLADPSSLSSNSLGSEIKLWRYAAFQCGMKLQQSCQEYQKSSPDLNPSTREIMTFSCSKYWFKWLVFDLKHLNIQSSQITLH